MRMGTQSLEQFFVEYSKDSKVQDYNAIPELAYQNR